MATLTLTSQNVSGDPFIDGNPINITTNGTSTLTFTDFDFQLHDPQAGEFVSYDGGATQLSYTFLGYGYVRNDPSQFSAYIRIDMGDGTFQTEAIDMNSDGDQLPNLQNGNTKLEVIDLTSGPPERFPAPACFVKGTRIATQRGEVAIECLRAGDKVFTADHGYQPLRGVAKARFRAHSQFAPVLFEKGAIGNTRPLKVSQQHRMLVTGWRAELACGHREVLVPAIQLVNGDTIRVAEGGFVTYFHLVFDQHEVILANGAMSESYLAGDADQCEATAQELARFFPGLALGGGVAGQRPARHIAKSFESAALAA